MRLLPLLIVGSFASVLAACDASSDCGGPTSDWPHCNHGDSDNAPGDPEQGNGGTKTGTDDNGGKSPPVLGGTKDAGSATSHPRPGGEGEGDHTPAPSIDAGVSVPATGADTDAGLGDGGVRHPSASDAGTDGGVVSDAAADGSASDAGMHCTFDADRRDAGGCFGVYCASDAVMLQSSVATTGACRSEADLTLVCDGAFSRVVSSCAQDDALNLGFGSTVRECARDEKSLDGASDGCIDCYVDELLCAAQNCLTPCLASLSDACTSCRVDRCGEAFTKCSGLPRPQ